MPAVNSWLVFCVPSARPLQNGPAISAIAVNAKPLSDTVITEAITITATLTGESSQSVSASRPIAAAAASAMVRIGRSREPTMSDQRPAAIRPPAPSIWAAVTIAPADAADQPRSLISHTSVNVHTTTWGTTSRTDTAWMRHNTDDPRYGLARSASSASCTRRPRRVDHRDRAHHRGHRAHHCGEQQRDRDAVAFRETRNHQGAQPDSQRLGGLPNAHHQAALLRRKPSDHQSAACRVAAGRRHAAEQQKGADRDERVHRRRRERRRRRQRRTQRQHDPLADPVDDVAPRDQRRHHAEAGHRRQQARLRQIQAAFGVQRRDEERRAVDEDVRAQRRAQRDDQHRPAAHGADRFDGHAAIVAQLSHDAEPSFHIVRHSSGSWPRRRDRGH